MRVAIIGLGGIAAKAYLPLLATWEGLDLLLFARRPEVVARYCAQYRLARGTSDWDELIRFAPRAAFVLASSAAHFEIASRLLDAGIDVFLEKPATLRSADTLSLGEHADVKKRIVMVGFNRRFAPVHAKARELWGGRRAGLGVFAKHREGAAHPDLFSNYIDDTIHIVDLLRFYCGEGQAVRTLAQTREGKLVGAVSVVALDSGGQGIVSTSLDAGRWSESYALHGAGATLEIEAFREARLAAEGTERVVGESAGGWGSTLEARGFPQQIRHFFDCVESRMTPLTSCREAFLTQRLLEDLVAACSAHTLTS